MAACEYRQAARSDSSGPDSGSVRKRIRDRSYEDLSRMKGNFHVRFLGECGRGNPPALTRQAGAGSRRRKQAPDALRLGV
jgi:hypothetical protein